MDLSKIASFITLDPSQLFRAERCVEQGLKMYNSDEELTEAYLKEHLHGVTLNYAMHVLDEASTSYMDVAIHNQGGKFSAPTAGVYGVSSRPEIKQKIKDKVLKKNELEKKQKSMKKEEVEEYVDFLITEGYDCSDLTWNDMYEEYQSLDEGLRSAVKRILGGKKKEEPAKPMSRGDQLRKKYNVGPERSDTSAKAQILKKTRAKADSDQKEFGGSRYSKGVADKSKAAHERQLKGGYSKYGADDARGKGNKARKRAAALTKEEVVSEEGADSLKDRRMERGGVDGNNRYNKAPGKPNTAGKKPSSGMSAFDKVSANLKKKYGDKAIISKKSTNEEVVVEKKDYDGDGKIESGSKEHAGVVHNAIQRAKGKKADGKDTRKEEVNLPDSLSSIAEGKVKCKKCSGKGCDDCKGKGYKVSHNCSSTVEHAEWGVGDCMPEMHSLDENGNVSHYDVLFSHGIEENVSVEDLISIKEGVHEHAINDEKNQIVESMKQARKNVGASTCWKGYKAQGTKTKDGKVVPNCVKEDEEIEEAIVELKGKKKGNVIINPEVKKVNEDAEVAKKQQVQRKQLMLNKQKLALQQKATTKKKPTDMHMEETEDIQEVDMSSRSVDYGQEIENTTLKRKKEKKSLSDFKKLSKPKES